MKTFALAKTRRWFCKKLGPTREDKGDALEGGTLPSIYTIRNKTGTSKVGAISKAQKAQFLKL